jgi:hypothetical protein
MNDPQHTQPLKPLSINGLLCLLGRPKDFFSGAFNLKHIPSLLVIGFLCGLERSNAAFSLTNLSTEQIADVYKGLSPAWSEVWIGFLPVAAFMGLLKWLVGGFWYNIRATWCGYEGGDTMFARSIFMFTEAIVAIPMVLHLMAQTLIYADPMAAQLDTNTSAFSLVAIVLGTVSILISYYAVQRLLNISGPKTRLWFLVLPLSAQCFALVSLVLSS